MEIYNKKSKSQLHYLYSDTIFRISAGFYITDLKISPNVPAVSPTALISTFDPFCGSDCLLRMEISITTHSIVASLYNLG